MADMESVDRNTQTRPVKKPWTAPKVILSDPMSGARRHSNKFNQVTPDNRASTLTSTSTS